MYLVGKFRTSGDSPERQGFAFRDGEKIDILYVEKPSKEQLPDIKKFRTAIAALEYLTTLYKN